MGHCGKSVGYWRCVMEWLIRTQLIFFFCTLYSLAGEIHSFPPLPPGHDVVHPHRPQSNKAN